jgi:hypothetical protein
MKAKFKSSKTSKSSSTPIKLKVRLTDASKPNHGLTTDSKANRETYLENAVSLFVDLFVTKGKQARVPAVRVSCGFPGGRGSKKVLGACWDANAAKDSKANIFISPLIDDTHLVLATLCHELVHACVGHDEGHGPRFRQLAQDIGLRGKMTATYPNGDLTAFIDGIIAQIGQYPHAKLSLTDNPVKKQTTRLIKCVCKASGYTVRTTRQWIDKYGAPISPATQKVMKVEWPDGEEPEPKKADKGGAK